MRTIDLKLKVKPYYTQRRGIVSIIDVPAFTFLMVDGEGDPNTSPAFSEACELLFSLSYTLKFMLKLDKKTYDYPVMGLEGLWWTKDMAQFSLDRKDLWEWTVMILQPEVITPALHAEAVVKLRKKKPLASIGRERLEAFEEGKSAQILHVGPFSTEGPTVAQLHDHIAHEGLRLRGKHHEIYFGDPRRTAPEKLKTIIRQPVV
ncbi:MAG: GyrI-like domain-containing protein [Ignavibacteriae bacterium]|nr:GyrI-like domain-containing protein [Ignavibacteriota bacterium]